jgi:hypothetical protein
MLLLALSGAVVAEPGEQAGRAVARHHRYPHMQIVLHSADTGRRLWQGTARRCLWVAAPAKR